MEAKIIDLHNMGSLGRLIKSGFPVREVRAILDDTDFTIYFEESVSDKAALVKAIYEFVKSYIEQHGSTDQEYQFTFYQGHDLIDILHFNNPEAAHYITMELFGKIQNLRIQDVMGATGDYTIYNENFETIGYFSAGVNPVRNEDGSAKNRGDDDYYSDEVNVDFADEAIWEVYPDELKPYFTEIREKLLEEINRNTQSMEVDVDDPVDVAFWAEQFQISEPDLRKAIFAAGKSIDDITTYLQQ